MNGAASFTSACTTSGPQGRMTLAVSRSTKCALERAMPHFDLTKQHCGAPDREKEVYRLGLAARSAKTPERRAAAARGIQAWKSGHVL